MRLFGRRKESAGPPLRLFVGLGNPGPAYGKNRHNVGFMAIDRLAEANGFGPWRARFRGLVSEGTLGGARMLLLKPQTYMNESGRAVAEAVRFYKVPLGEMVVWHDELDLAAGKVRVKKGGGAAGHNGIRSITAMLGEPDFVRVRIGIGHPGDKDRVLGHALGDFSRADQTWLEPLLDALADAAPRLVEGDEAGFMNRVAVLTAPPREARKAASEA